MQTDSSVVADGAATEHSAAARAGGPPPSRRIVLIEDDAFVGAAVGHCLRQQGHRLVYFTAASSGREWIAGNGCDLVITDIPMPGSDGLELIQWLRRDHPQVEIIAILGTDLGGNSHLRAALLLGATRILQKPFELAALAELVDQVTRRESAP